MITMNTLPHIHALIVILIMAVVTGMTGFIIGEQRAIGYLNDIPDYNLSCPAAEVHVPEPSCPQANISVSPQKNYIQPSHNDIDFQHFENGDFVIEDIANYGKITGMSMRPTLFTGNTVINTKYTHKSQIQAGDIIRYKDGDTYVIHRVKSAYDNYVVTQGDNVPRREYIDYENITHEIIGVLFT